MLTTKADTDVAKALEDEDDAAFKEDEKARIAALHKSAPEVIWLQVDPEAEQFDGWEAQTWCEDKINETDVKYVRADLTPNIELTGAARHEAGIDALREENKNLRSALHDCVKSLQGYRCELSDGQPCDAEKAAVAILTPNDRVETTEPSNVQDQPRR